MPDEDKLIGRFQKNAREEVRVMLRNFKGTDLIDIRAWYKDQDGELKPGRDGIAVRIEKLPVLRDLVNEAHERAIEEGMLH